MTEQPMILQEVLRIQQEKENQKSEQKVHKKEEEKKTKGRKDDNDDDDDMHGGLMRPVVELVKGFIPRLTKPNP